MALLDPDNDFTKEQRTKMLQDIQQDAQWLFRMVENLLSITKLDSGKVKIIKIPTVLDELIDSVILKFHKRYPDQEVEIDIPDEFVVGFGLDYAQKYRNLPYIGSVEM